MVSSLLHPVSVIDESSGEENLLVRYRFLLHREWNQECNNFHDCPLVELYDLLWRFWYVSSHVQGLSRIEVLWSSCFEDYSPNPSFQVVHQSSVSHEVLLLEKWKLLVQHYQQTWSSYIRQSVSRSPETACPTRCVPIWAIMLGDSTNTDTLVSSMLYTLTAVNFQDLSARS